MQWFVDIDGVLLNFEAAFVRFLNRAYGMSLPEDYNTPRWFFDHLMSPEDMLARWQAFLDAPDSGEMAPLVAPERFNALAAGHEVHLLTNFPAPYMAKRKANLSDLGFQYESLHYAGLYPYGDHTPPTKAQVVEGLRAPAAVGLFVDDHPENCLDVLTNCEGVEVWVMTRLFNLTFEHPRVRRAHGWDSLFARVAEPGK